MKDRSAALDVVEVFPARRRDRRRFVDLPFRLAAAHGPWQPGVRRLQEDVIDPARNPYWRGRRHAFFVATRGGEAVGRIALVDGGLADLPGTSVFAFPDFEDDAAVVDALLGAVEGRAREWGACALAGPLNPNIHHDVGIQVHGHERRNAVLMGYQPPYYQAHFERRGFQPLADFEAWSLDRETFLADGRLERAVRRVERQSALRIRPADLGRFDDELKIFFRLYAGAFAGHWGFSAPSWEEFQFLAGDLRHLLRPNMALVAEWDDEPIGFVLGIPDVYAIIPKETRGRMTPRFLLTVLRRWRRVDEARVMIAGVLPAYRRHGVHLPLFYRVARAIFALGFRGGEISWVMTGNEGMRRALTLLGAQPTKTYRVYTRPLHQ
jgi:hypothetical protein